MNKKIGKPGKYPEFRHSGTTHLMKSPTYTPPVGWLVNQQAKVAVSKEMLRSRRLEKTKENSEKSVLQQNATSGDTLSSLTPSSNQKRDYVDSICIRQIALVEIMNLKGVESRRLKDGQRK